MDHKGINKNSCGHQHFVGYKMFLTFYFQWALKLVWNVFQRDFQVGKLSSQVKLHFGKDSCIIYLDKKVIINQ